MAKEAPTRIKGDQPRAGTSSVKSDSPRTPDLQYRVQGMKSFDRSPSVRNYGRAIRG